MPWSRYQSTVAFIGARPEPLSAIGGAALGRIKHEAIAADAGHMRLDDAQHGDRGDGGVDRIAAGAQHVERGQGRERMRDAAMAMTGDGGGAAGLEKVAHALSCSFVAAACIP